MAFMYLFVTQYVTRRLFIMWFSYICCVIAYFANIIMIIYPLFCKLVILSSNTYLCATYFWVIVVILNTVLKVRIGYSRFGAPFACFFICLMGMSTFKPSEYFEGYPFWKFSIIFISNIIIIIIMILQFYYGSRFYLPNKCRTRIYDRLTCKLNESNLLINDVYCQLCMNCLNEPELQYSDSDLTYKWKKHESNEYILTKCGHKFHYNCIIKYLRDNKNCPSCNISLPEDEYDD